MDSLAIYKTVFTLLFVLAAVFFVITVVLFFLLDIRSVFRGLHGKGALAVRVKKSTPTAVQGNNGRVVTEKMQKHPGTVMARDGGATMTERFLQTVNTVRISSENGMTQPETEKVSISDNQEMMPAKCVGMFRPEREIIVYSSKQRIG